MITKNNIIIIDDYHTLVRHIIYMISLATVLTLVVQVNSASAVIHFPSDIPQEIVVNHSDWVEFVGDVPPETTPWSKITKIGETLYFPMTYDSSSGIWHTPTIMFSSSASCTSDDILKILCVGIGDVIAAQIVYRDQSGAEIPGPVAPNISITDGGSNIDITTYTQPAFYDNKIYPCTTRTGYVFGAQGIDSDKDGLCDNWEQNGKIVIKYDNIGEYTFICEPGTCTKDKKDVFIEIDYLRGHKPSQIVIDHIKNAIAVGQVTGSTPGNIPGIDVHVVLDEAIPHKDCTSFPGDNAAPGFDQIKSNFFGTSSDRSQNIDPNWFHNTGWKLKRYAFHYVLIAHTQCGSASTGVAEQWGNDAMIMLGGTDSKIGTIDQQEGTMLHELGHNFGLDHGGKDSVNCKPNEPSVMSYSRQFSDMVSDRQLDFSRVAVGTTDTITVSPPYIDESNLRDGIGLSSHNPQTRVAYGPITRYTTTGASAIDWDEDSNTSTASMDLNRITWEGNVVCDGTNGASGTKLNGYNDWSLVKLDGRGSSNLFDGRPAGVTAAAVFTGGSVHSKECKAIHSIPEHLRELALKNYRVCSAGKSITTNEMNLLNARNIADKLSKAIKQNPNMPQADKVKKLITDINIQLKYDKANNALAKISAFKKSYSQQVTKEINDIINIKPTKLPNKKYQEITQQNIQSMRKIRIDTLERFIDDYTQKDRTAALYYQTAFAAIREYIDKKNMNMAILALHDVMNTYDGEGGDDLILTDALDDKTRMELIDMTKDVLLAFGKAVNDPHLATFTNHASKNTIWVNPHPPPYIITR